MEKVITNNQVAISGEIVSGFTFSHEVFGEGFYMTSVRCQRYSGSYDEIPIMVSERLVDVEADWKGLFVRVSGQFRSYNRKDGEKKRLVLYLFAREFEVWEENGVENGAQRPIDENTVFLDGFVCKEPVYRKTPLGREIADLLLAVNRSYGKTDYVPCIAWGRNARYAGYLEIGTRLKAWGRIQSREYKKRISDGEYETRVAYEVSIQKMEVAEDEQGED